MERYEKLYARIDEVFRGTPNTPSALSIKSEIIDNLTARYDELLAGGVSENEAVEQVVDTIGDLNELFGIRKIDPIEGGAAEPLDSGNANGRKKRASGSKTEYRTLTEEEQNDLWKRKKLRSFSVALYILSIIPPMLIGAGLSWILGCALMFLFWAVATALIIGAGAWTPGANRKRRWLIACGTGMYIGAFVPMFLLMENVLWGVAGLFVGWAAATVLILLGTGIKNDTAKIRYEGIGKNDGLDSESRRIWRPIRAVMVLITLGVYLWFSFFTNGWLYSWVIWVIYGCLADAVKALLVLLYQKEEKQ